MLMEEISHEFVSEPFFFYKSEFFRLVGNVIQQIKKVSHKQANLSANVLMTGMHSECSLHTSCKIYCFATLLELHETKCATF